MNIHKNARLTPLCREQMCRAVLYGGMSYQQAAHEYKVSTRTVAKWVKRYREQDYTGHLYDRSSRPYNSPRRITSSLERAIEYAKNLASIPEPSPDLTAKRKKKKQEDEAKQAAYNELNKQKAFTIFNNAKPIDNSLAPSSFCGKSTQKGDGRKRFERGRAVGEKS